MIAAERFAMRWTSALVVVLAMGFGVRASAQQMPAGTRVRLTTPESFTGWHVGRVTSMTRDSVRIRYANGDSASIALANVGLMDSSGGTHTPLWAKLSSVVTIPAGGIAGILGGAFVSAAASTELDTYMEEGLWVGTATGLIAGVVIAATHKSEDWNPVMLPAQGRHIAGDSPASAIDASAYRPRMRLKLRIGERNVVGTLVEQRDDSIVLAWNSGHTSYPVASVSYVQVSRGKSAWTGAKFGGLIGAGVGVVIGVREAIAPNDSFNAPRDPDCDVNTMSCRYDSDVVLATKRLAGYTLLGAAAGAVIRREHWVKGELPATARDRDPARLLLSPDHGGMRIGVRATF